MSHSQVIQPVSVVGSITATVVGSEVVVGSGTFNIGQTATWDVASTTILIPPTQRFPVIGTVSVVGSGTFLIDGSGFKVPVIGTVSVIGSGTFRVDASQFINTTVGTASVFQATVPWQVASTTVFQGTSPWIISGANQIQPVIGSITVVGSGSFLVNSAVSGSGTFVVASTTVFQGTSPWVVSSAIQPVIGSLTVVGSGSFLVNSAVSGSGTFVIASTTVFQGTSPWITSGAAQIFPVVGTISVIGSGTFRVNASGFVNTTVGTASVLQATSPWVVSGTVNQGSPNSDSQAWPIRITDGTLDLPLYTEGDAPTTPIGMVTFGQDASDRLFVPTINGSKQWQVEVVNGSLGVTGSITSIGSGTFRVDASAFSLTVLPHAVTIALGGVASGAIASGAIASGAVAAGAFASGSIVAGAVAAGATSFVKLEDVASADADAGVPAMAIRKATPANTSGTDGDYEMLQVSAGRLWVDPSGVTLTVATHAITIASGGVASGAIASGAVASGAIASGAVASGAVASGAFASGSIVAGAVAAGATSFVKLEDVASADADAGVPAMAIRKATPGNTSGTDGDYEMLQISAGRLWASATVDAALPAGTNVIGALSANQSVNVAQINGVTTTMGNGVSGTGVQRVTLASDSTGQVTLAAGANTIGALTANQSVNVAQINGVTTLMGNGATGTGSQRVTIASDNTAFQTKPVVSATATQKNSTVSTSAVLVIASNANRLKCSLVNNSVGNAYVGFANTVTTSGSTIGQLMGPSGGTWEPPEGINYTGDVYVIYDIAASAQNIAGVEYTA